MKNASYDGFLSIQETLRDRRESGFYSDLESHPCLLAARNFIADVLIGCDFTVGSFGPGENLQGVNPQMLRDHAIAPSSFLDPSFERLFSPAYELAERVYGQQFRPAFMTPVIEEQLESGELNFDHYFHKSGLIPGLHPESLPYEDRRSAKMIAVPKTSRKARLIGKMHTDFVYLQSCIASGIRKKMVSTPFYASIFPMLDQTIPSNSAVAASYNGEWATVDLSAASDYVSWDLVKLLVPEEFSLLLGDLRAQTVVINRNGTLERHATYSYGQMGDGTTFVILSLVCAALSYAAICSHRDFIPEPKFPLINYGDDLQFPTLYAPVVIDVLEQFGLKVNASKSYTSFPGYFRESCDGWGAYGYPVKPTWIKHVPDTSNFTTIPSALHTARELDRRGYKVAAERLYSGIEACLGIKLPLAHSSDPFFGRFRRTMQTYRYIGTSGLTKVPVWRISSMKFSTSFLSDFYNAVRAPNEDTFWRDKKANLRSLVGFKLVPVRKLGVLEPESKLCPIAHEYNRSQQRLHAARKYFRYC